MPRATDLIERCGEAADDGLGIGGGGVCGDGEALIVAAAVAAKAEEEVEAVVVAALGARASKLKVCSRVLMMSKLRDFAVELG